MAFKLQIVDKKLGVNANVRYENLARAEKPTVVAKAPDGTEVKKTMFDSTGNKIVGFNWKWADSNGQEYAESTLSYWIGDEQVEKRQKTTVFDVTGYEPLENYTDMFVIDSYYELWADHNDKKKDFEKDLAIKANQIQMRKLWDYLIDNKQVARGYFNVSSSGFVESDGFIRAVKINGSKWGLEIGVFKERKDYQHLQEQVPVMTQQAQPVSKTKKVRMM